MNQTVTANLSGIVFHIEVDAYNQLKEYLNKIKGYFKDSSECEEIMADIEARIAELLGKKIVPGNQVIQEKDVREVIDIMGKPEQYLSEDEAGFEQESGPKSHHTDSAKIKKRVFRDPDDRVLGGVASGLGQYFGIDPVWLRLAFVVALFFGFGILTYIILWIIIPTAKTASEKLQMKGEPINVENIGKSFEKGAQNVNQKIKDLEKEGFSKKLESFFKSVFGLIGTLIKGIFKALAKLLGLFFLLIGILLAIGFTAGLLNSDGIVFSFNETGLTSIPIVEFLQTVFVSDSQFYYAKIALLTFIGIPILGLILGGIKLIFSIRGKMGFGLMLGIIWFISLVCCIMLGLSLATDFKTEAVAVDRFGVQNSFEEFVLKMNDEPVPGEKVVVHDDSDFFLYADAAKIYYGFPGMDILPSEDSVYIEIKRICRGSTLKNANDRATRIDYQISQSENLLEFNSYLAFDKEDKIRAQEVQIVLYLPVGKRVYLDESIGYIIYDIDNVTNTLDSDMLGHVWEMRQEGLTCLDCPDEIDE